MMTREDIVIIFLSLQALLLSGALLKAEKRVSFLEGKQSVQEDVQRMADETLGAYTTGENVKHDKTKHTR